MLEQSDSALRRASRNLPAFLIVVLGIGYLPSSVAHDSLGTHSNRIVYDARQIVSRLNAEMAHPARYSGMFNHDPDIGRLATVSNCSNVAGSVQSGMYRCDLDGIPAGVVANVMISNVDRKVASVTLAVEAENNSSVGLSAMTFVLAQTCLIIAVDPYALRTGITAKPQVTRIVEQLTPQPGSNETHVVADGLLFTQRALGSDLTLEVTPAE